MSTRCCVRIHNPEHDNDCPVLLYHQHDGYQEFMLPKLEKFLQASYDHLVQRTYDYAWNSSVVAALFVLFSVENHADPLIPFCTDRPDNPEAPHDKCRPNGGLPEFLPCGGLYDNLEYIYDIWLLPVSGEFRIESRSANPQE